MKITAIKTIEFQPDLFAQPGQTFDVDDAYGQQLVADGLAKEGEDSPNFEQAEEAEEVEDRPKPVTKLATNKSASSRPGSTATEL